MFIEQRSNGPQPIVGVATSITAFVGRAWKGPLDTPVEIRSYAEYERTFGGLWRASTMSYAVQQFFDNGGTQALVVRVATRSGAGSASAAAIDLGGTVLAAKSPGTWGRNLSVALDYNDNDPAKTTGFTLTILDDPSVALAADSQRRGGSGAREVFLDVSLDSASPRFITTVLEQESELARVAHLGVSPPAAGIIRAGPKTGADGISTSVQAAAAEVLGDTTDQTGIYALLGTEVFNLLVVPPLTISTSRTDTPTTLTDVPMAVWTAAAMVCKDSRALLIVDAPRGWTVAAAAAGIQSFGAIERSYAALYFPRVLLPDPLQQGAPAEFPPSGAVAGVMSRTDDTRGVWAAPAGLAAHLTGVVGLSINGSPATLNDDDSDRLTPLGINCLRAFANVGYVLWGARTLDSTPEWTYVPVRRLALFIEQSIFQGTQWAVFEPNGEPLWAQIRLSAGAFLDALFRQGAFQGATPKDAYYVKCGTDTMTQNDIDRGALNVVIGIAPVRPAEFVIISIQQMLCLAHP